MSWTHCCPKKNGRAYRILDGQACCYCGGVHIDDPATPTDAEMDAVFRAAYQPSLWEMFTIGFVMGCCLMTMVIIGVEAIQ